MTFKLRGEVKSGLRLFFIMYVVGLVGCQSKVEISPVTGTVIRDGKPMSDLLINFMPDPDSNTIGGMSMGVTDGEGKYTLSYQPTEGVPGAVVGKHRVTFNDLASENYRGPGRPPAPRIPHSLMIAGNSPVIVDVQSGEQVIDIDLSPYK